MQSETPQNDYLWAILPTNFKDSNGNEWMFRKLTLRDMSKLEQRGYTTQRLLTEMQLLETMTIAYEFLEPVTPNLSKPSLDEFFEVLSEDCVSDALEAYRRCLTNFFPRSQRESARTLIQQEQRLLRLLAEQQALAMERVLNSTVSSESASPSEESSVLSLGNGLTES